MALAYTDFTTRIDNELKLLDSFSSAVQTALLKDALSEMCRLGDVEISESLSVTDGQQEYDYPDTIKKIHILYDDSTPPVEVPYTDETYRRKIYLQDDPDENAVYTIYGTPYEVRTNYDDIIAALPEEWGDILWQFVRYHCMKQARDQSWVVERQAALQMLKEHRQSKNRSEDVANQSMQHLDRKGYRIDDTNNSEGLNVDYSDHLEIDVG